MTQLFADREPNSLSVLSRSNLHDRIVEALGTRIVAGEFSEGSTMPTEDALATQLGVSRNALREAMKVLASKGLLEIRPKTGTRILPTAEWNLLDREVLAWHAHSELRLTRAFELVEFRLIVEPRAAFLAARRATSKDLTAIADNCALLETCVGEPELVPLRDIAFHRSIHQASHNAILNHLGSLTSSLMQIQVLMTTQAPGSFEHGLPLHRQLTEAITRREAELAEQLSRQLVQMPYQDLAERHEVPVGHRLDSSIER